MEYYTTQELAAVFIGCLIIGLLCAFGILLTGHLIFNLVRVTSPNNLYHSSTSKTFHTLCILFLVLGSIELTFQLILFINKFFFASLDDFLRYNQDTAFIENAMTMLVDFLHTSNCFLITIIFIIRLQKVLNGSIYDYPSKMYKYITIACIFNIILAFIGVAIDGTNEILQEINSNIPGKESADWYIDFIPSFLPTILLAVTMLMYIIQQIILVLLMKNGFNKVCQFILDGHEAFAATVPLMLRVLL